MKTTQLFLASIFSQAVFARPACSNFSPNKIELFNEVCLRVCWPMEPQCPETWNAKKFGECHTCCKDLGYEVPVSLPALKKSSVAAPEAVTTFDGGDPGICLRVCWFEKPSCPEGWKATQFGECYTCCKPYDSIAQPAIPSEMSIKEMARISDEEDGDLTGVCLRMCIPPEAKDFQCPPNFGFKNDEFCGTCCLKKNYQGFSINAGL